MTAQKHLKDYIEQLPAEEKPNGELIKTMRTTLYAVFAYLQADNDRAARGAEATKKFLETKIALGHGKTVIFFDDLNEKVNHCLPLRELNRNARPLRKWIAAQVWKETNGRAPKPEELKGIEPIPISKLRETPNMLDKLDSKEFQAELGSHESIKKFNRAWTPSTCIQTPYFKIRKALHAVENALDGLPPKQKAELLRSRLSETIKTLLAEVEAFKNQLEVMEDSSADIISEEAAPENARDMSDASEIVN